MPTRHPSSEVPHATAFIDHVIEIDQASKRRSDFAGDKRRILRGTTTEMIDQVPNDSLDFAYVDGDHTLRGITNDLINIWPKIRVGGVIMGDDFCATIWQHHHKYEPTMVFPFAVYFAEAMKSTIVAVSNEQFVLQKTSEASGFVFHDPKGIYDKTSVQSHVTPTFDMKLKQTAKVILPKNAKSFFKKMRG